MQVRCKNTSNNNNNKPRHVSSKFYPSRAMFLSKSDLDEIPDKESKQHGDKSIHRDERRHKQTKLNEVPENTNGWMKYGSQCSMWMEFSKDRDAQGTTRNEAGNKNSSKRSKAPRRAPRGPSQGGQRIGVWGQGERGIGIFIQRQQLKFF